MLATYSSSSIFNLMISSLSVVLFTKKKKPGRVDAKSETKFPYLTAAVNPDNVKSSKYPLEKYKSPGKQMSKAWIKKEAEFDAKKEAKEELGCAVDTDLSKQCHTLLQKHKEEKNVKKDELNSAEERLDAIHQEKYQQVRPRRRWSRRGTS